MISKILRKEDILFLQVFPSAGTARLETFLTNVILMADVWQIKWKAKNRYEGHNFLNKKIIINSRKILKIGQLRVFSLSLCLLHISGWLPWLKETENPKWKTKTWQKRDRFGGGASYFHDFQKLISRPRHLYLSLFLLSPRPQMFQAVLWYFHLFWSQKDALKCVFLPGLTWSGFLS